MTDTTSSPVRSSANDGAIDTASDVEFSPPLRGIYVETAGRLKGQFKDGSAFDITSVAAGWLPMREVSLIESETSAVIHGFL